MTIDEFTLDELSGQDLLRLISDLNDLALEADLPAIEELGYPWSIAFCGGIAGIELYGIGLWQSEDDPRQPRACPQCVSEGPQDDCVGCHGVGTVEPLKDFLLAQARRYSQQLTSLFRGE